MIKRQFSVFLFRWLVSSAGMWLCIKLFGNLSVDYDPWLFIVAGLIFSLANSVVKPLITVLTLPLIVLSLGLFVFVVNITIMALTIWVLPDVSMDLIDVALSALTMSIINGLVNFLVPSYNKG